MVAEFVRGWITFSLMILSAAAGVAFWAARAGHFRHQDRARSLALWAWMEEENKKISPQRHGGTEKEKMV